MVSRFLSLVVFVSIIISCNKEKPIAPETPTDRVEIQLKDISWQHLPSPYYHFDYNDSGFITNASYSSSALSYDVFYTGFRIRELKNLVGAYVDKIQYTYDQNLVTVIKYYNKTGIIYKRCFLTYNSSRQIIKMEWELKIENMGFAAHRTVTFSYYPDGNLVELSEQRHAIPGVQTASLILDRFENYDQQKNVDAFSLLHRSDEHMVLLPSVVLQKNNPGKNIRSGDGIHYEISYTYQYNSSQVPVSRKGDVLFTSGPDAGTHFESNVNFSYYE